MVSGIVKSASPEMLGLPVSVGIAIGSTPGETAKPEAFASLLAQDVDFEDGKDLPHGLQIGIGSGNNLPDQHIVVDGGVAPDDPVLEQPIAATAMPGGATMATLAMVDGQEALPARTGKTANPKVQSALPHLPAPGGVTGETLFRASSNRDIAIPRDGGPQPVPPEPVEHGDDLQRPPTLPQIKQLPGGQGVEPSVKPQTQPIGTGFATELTAPLKAVDAAIAIPQATGDFALPAMAKGAENIAPMLSSAPSTFSTPALENMIERLVEARGHGQEVRGEMTLRHAEFGAIRAQINDRSDGLHVALSSAGGDFVASAQAALSDRNMSHQSGQDNNNQMRGHGGQGPSADAQTGQSRSQGENGGRPHTSDHGVSGRDRARANQPGDEKGNSDKGTIFA